MGVFGEPVDLSLSRAQNYVIPLLIRNNSIKVQPYRYPHCQKEQIEKMVNDMLNQCII